jgi:hypothetical protein
VSGPVISLIQAWLDNAVPTDILPRHLGLTAANKSGTNSEISLSAIQGSVQNKIDLPIKNYGTLVLYSV